MTGTASERKVVLRTVFYIEGYDPRGPQHYHRLYRDEAAKQAQVNGLAVTVGARRRIDEVTHAWDVETAGTRTSYRFLRYDDLMRQRWSRGTLAVLGDIVRYSKAFLLRGVFLKTLRISWTMLITILLAPSLLLLALLISLAAGGIVAAFAPWYAGALITACGFIGLVMLRPIIEPRFAAFWLARICAFISDQGSGLVPHMEERIKEFASRIAAEVKRAEADEVLVAGHSVGTHVGVAVCAEVLRLLSDEQRTFSFLTLGHTIPLLGLQPQAHEFRKDLQRVSEDPRITWIDVSAAIDGACFPLTDPVSACGLKQADPDKPSPKIVSARFSKLFTPETYKKLRRDFARAHFQYLMAAELPGDYDYFLITAGDMTLGQRFAHLKSVTGFNRFRLGRS